MALPHVSYIVYLANFQTKVSLGELTLVTLHFTCSDLICLMYVELMI